MQFEVRNRLTGAVRFTAEIEATADTPLGVKLGLAVRLAVKAKADLRGADLRHADLSGADLRGAYLRHADLRGADLSGADLRGAYLRHADLRGADLRGAYLRHADLRGADLSGADLRGAYLRHADLRGADLRGAPVIEDIHAKVYAAASQPGALNMGQWHCGTSHCRAGWVVTLAGKEGADLEAKIGTSAAAMAIYMASDPERWTTERLPDFYCGNETALADMARMAGVDGVADLTDTAGR
jgi:uncharacterized protein YjbI with pentapeptide repeats